MERRFYNAVRDILSEKTAVEHKQGQSVAPRHGDWLKKKKRQVNLKTLRWEQAVHIQEQLSKPDRLCRMSDEADTGREGQGNKHGSDGTVSC